MQWDLFCKVIDNLGDAGVCWRLAAELGARGESVRLWMDDASMLAWMAPQGHPRVTVLPWSDATPIPEPGQVVVEAFGCDPPPAFVARLSAAARGRAQPPAWINLEYLSAESYVERSHGLPSPVLHGPAAGLVKRFWYPGFTARTGGLLREQGLQDRMASFVATDWLRGLGIDPAAGRCFSLFCYEPQALPQLLRQLAAASGPSQLLVTAGRAARATEAAVTGLDAACPGWNAAGRLRLHWLPLLAQPDYDHLLWSCDFNFVRGEDSAVRALLAGRPFAWQLYPQDDGAHQAKLLAFLDWLQPPPDWRALLLAWNGMATELPRLDPLQWREAARAAAERAWSLPELAGGLLQLAAGKVE